MANTVVVEPDLKFIKEITRLGGVHLKKCFQCSTCVAACPISPETKPFPRKEMLAASWGLKNKLIGNADIWLCHNCGDCSELCPRGAKPGDVLSAIRTNTIEEYSKPKFLAKIVNDPKKLPFLLGIPVVIFLLVGFLLKMFGINWLNFTSENDIVWQADYISNYLVDIIMIPTFFISASVFVLGLKRFLLDIHNNALLEEKTNKTSINYVDFFKALIKIIPTIIKHKKFTECNEGGDRATPHMMVLFGFILLFIVTQCFFVAEWVFHIEGPYSQINPIKWLGNIGGFALIVGGFVLLKNRLGKEDQVSTYNDWILIWLVISLGLTGMLTEMLRLGEAHIFSAIIYFIHIIFVWCLFAYAPFSKLAHLAYRTVAMAYNEYSGRK